MSLTKKQIEIDKMKWEKSEQLGKDACGSFDFCGKCDKSLENPCDKAYSSFKKEVKPAAKPRKKAVKAKEEPAKAKATAKKTKAAATEVAATKVVKKRAAKKNA